MDYTEYIKPELLVLIPVLLGQLLLHGVEGFDVLQLPLYGLLAGKAHRQQAEPVPVHQIHGVLLAPILEAGKMEHGFGG